MDGWMDLSVGQQCPTLILSFLFAFPRSQLFTRTRRKYRKYPRLSAITTGRYLTILCCTVGYIYLYHPLDLSLNYFHRTFIFSRGLDPYPTQDRSENSRATKKEGRRELNFLSRYDEGRLGSGKVVHSWVVDRGRSEEFALSSNCPGRHSNSPFKLRALSRGREGGREEGDRSLFSTLAAFEDLRESNDKKRKSFFPSFGGNFCPLLSP